MVQPDMLAQERACTRCDYVTTCGAKDGSGNLIYSCGDYNGDDFYDFVKAPANSPAIAYTDDPYMPAGSEVYFGVVNGHGNKCGDGSYDATHACMGGNFLQLKNLSDAVINPAVPVPQEYQPAMTLDSTSQAPPPADNFSLYRQHLGSSLAIGKQCTGSCCAHNTSCGDQVAVETCGCKNACVLTGACPMTASDYANSFVATFGGACMSSKPPPAIITTQDDAG